MKTISVSAKKIGTSVVTDLANIGHISSSTEERHSQVEACLINALLEQSTALQQLRIELSPEQIQAMGKELAQAMSEIINCPENIDKKTVLEKKLVSMKSTLGPIVDTLQIFLKLTALFGIK